MRGVVRYLILGLVLGGSALVHAQDAPIEVHNRVALPADAPRQVALTLDACSGHYDAALIDFLIEKRIPATLFVTKRWLVRNAEALQVLKANLDLFDIENHGERHLPSVIGEEREVYGLHGVPDLEHLRREVREGAKAVEQAVGVKPRWYRGATALYDPEAIEEIQRMGFEIAGFSINADSGATLERAAIERRLQHVRTGDVIIAHMNKPHSDTAQGLTTGLTALQAQGFAFVRLDQVALRRVR
jgi:peptidoglycan/xylan/chitin deacetylase (PgdA/CDA1 family)